MVEFSFEALEENAVSFRRIEGFLQRARTDANIASTDVLASARPAAFNAAMDDDLGVPQALAVVHDTVREGNAALARDDVAAAAQAHDAVVAMLDVLGVNPYADPWASTGSDDAALHDAVDSLIGGLLQARADARASKDWATADRIRDQLAHAGIVVDDTAGGVRWSLGKES
jgi:cysteinyl-tRNA synthetase